MSDSGIGNLIKSAGNTAKTAVRAVEAGTKLAKRTASAIAKTARENSRQTERRWYEGDQPTAREMLAQVGRLSESNPTRAREAFDLYNQAISDRNSPVWNPYAKATNTGAVEALAAMGVDMSGGITKDRIDALKQYADYEGHVGVSGAPLAPTKKSTEAQNLAYWLYQLDRDEATTQKAEAEWADLQKYLSDQVKLGMADDEILDGITWSKYGTLTGMDEARSVGVPTQLNRAVGYSKDAMYGVLWAARNPEAATSDMMVNAANYALGRGTMLKTASSKQYAAEDDVSNYAAYNPYKLTGGTFGKYVRSWGLKKGAAFTLDDVLAHREELLSLDKGEKVLGDMLTAVENTDKAKAEMAALKKQIKSWQRSGMSADEIWDAITAALDTDYPTLARMEEGRIKGDPIPMAGEVDFSLPRFKAELLGGAIETELYRPEENAQDLETYNPYRRRGGAFAELVSAWADIGADGAITPEILEAHREEILSAKDGSKTYEKIQSAIKTSEKASAELAALNEQITRLEQRGKQADEIWKRISNDFATNYPTLNKMEEKRRAGTALTTAGGVDFSMSELKRRVYGEPEPETATAAEDAWATDTEEAPTAAPTEAPTAAPTEAPTAEPTTEPVKKVVYTSALAAEIDKLLEGKQAKSPEAQSWYDEYGYLLGGEQAYYKDTGGETLTLYQDQRAKLGQQAIDALEVDRVGEKGGYIDADTRIRHAVTLSEDVKAAQDAGVSLPEYYQAHPELTEKFDQWRAEAGEARSAWQAEIEAAQQQQRDEINAQIMGVYNYDQTGDAGYDFADPIVRDYLRGQILSQNISTLMKNDAGYKAERDTLSDAIISKLNAGNDENDYYLGVGSIASALFDHASDILDTDAKYASAMGMTLEEFYEAHPEARKDPDELAAQAIENFNQIWAQGDGEELALELLRSYKEEATTSADTQDEQIDYGDTPEGDVSWAGALGRGARTGLWQWVNGKLEPINVFGRAAAISESRALLDSSDEYLAAQARNFSRSDYRAAIEESVENMANEADRQYWTERLTNWDGDIYNIGFDIDYEALQNNINKRKKAIQADSDFVNKNGSGAERTMFNISSNLTHNLALLAENTLVSSATGLGALSGSLSAAGEGKNLVARALSKAASVAVGSIPTAYTYGLPEGAEMAQSLERDYGIDPVTAATYGGAQAIITGMMESVLGIDKVLGSFNSPTMKAIAKVFDEDDLHALGLVGMTKNLIKNGFRDTFNLMLKMAVASSGSEAFQEGAEYIEGAGMKALAASVNSDMSFSEAWHREANAGDLWESMKQGGMMGFLLGMASADVGLMTGQTQIYDMATHEAGRDAANRLLRADASNMTQEEALELLDLVAADMKANPTLLEDAAADYQAAMITADKIANGALTGVDAQFEAQLTEAQSALEATEAAAQEADTALQQAAQQQLEAEGALKAAAGDKRKAQLMQAQLKTTTDLLQSAKERAETANAARDEAAQSLTALNLEKESSQLAAFEELRSRSASLVAQIRAEKQANAEEKARQEQERQQAIDNADAHPESQIAQTQAEVAEAEREVQAAERAQILERRTGRSEALEQAQAALEEEEALADAVRENYGGLKQRLRTTRITLTDTQRQEAANIAGSYNQYRRSLFGTFNIVAEGGTSLDSLWQELSEQYPELFPAGTNEGDMMARLMEIKSDIFGAEGRVKAARARLAEAQKAAEAQNAALERIDNAAPEETEALLREAVSNDVLSESDAQRIGEKKGVTFEDRGFDGKAGVKLQISPKRKKQLTSIQSAQIRMLDAIANDYGLAITVSDDVDANGVRFRGTNRMVINLDAAGDAILQAGVHESVHFIAEFNPEGFGDMVDFAREALIESGMDWDEAIERRKAEYAQQGRTLTDAQAVEEIVAETYPSMFTDEAVLHKFAMEHKSALRSIKRFFEKFWQKLTDIARNVLGLTREGGFSHDEVFALVGDSPVLRKMYELFIESADKAGAYLTDVESADRRLAGYRAEESAKGIRYGLEGGTSYDLRANENVDLSLMPRRDKPVQSQEKTYTELMSALNIQYTKGHRGFAARDGRVSYGNPTTGTVHATAVQSDTELPAQLSRQLNYRLHLDDIPELMTELLPKVRVVVPGVNTMTQAEQREAALAVYTRLWLYNRGAAVALAGDAFTKAFEAKLRDRGYLRAMQKAQTELTRYINAPESVRSTSMVDMDTVAQPKQKTSLGRWLEVKLADKTYAVQRVTDLLREQLGEENVPTSRDPRTLLLANSNKGQNFVDYIIEEGLVSPQGDEIGSSLSSILRKVGKDKETQREFNAYWLSLHKLDRMKAERRVSYEDADTVKEAIRQYEAKHPEWKAIVEEATDWYDTFMRSWVVDTGMLSEDEYENLHTMYPHYIPTYRTLYQSAENARNGGGTNGTTSGLREATGSDLDVFNPIVGLVENVQHLVANYKSAEVGRALVDAIRRTTDNGFIAEIVDTPENTTLNKEYYDSPVTMNLAQLGRGGIQMGRDKAGNNIMTVMDADGSLVSLQINDPLLADVLLHSQPQDMGRVFNAARRVKALITNTATALSLGFSIPNALSDFGTAVMTGSFATNPITGAMKWLAAASEYTLNHAKDSLNSNLGTDFNTSEIYRAYKLFGALNSRYNLREHNAREELQTKLYGGSVTFAEVRDAFERSPILGVGSALTALPKLLIRNPVEWINNNIENATRYTEFRYGKNSARGGYSDLLAAGRASREVTADFSRAGTSRSLAIAKTSIPFFGAAIAGLNKSIMLPSGENRGRRAAILAKAGEIAAIGMMMGLARGLWSDDDKEFYDLLQDDYKMKYYILPLDGNGHFIRIKKSQDAAYLLADQIGEFLANYVTQADGGELGDLVGSAATLFKSTTDLTTIFDPLLDVRTNSTWYGTPIESYAMQQKPVGDRYNADTSPIWRGISNMVNAFGADWSPLDVEYLARQYMGSYGTILGKTLREATNGTLSARSFGQIVMDRLSGRLTIDGATANQASNIFYEGYNLVSQIAQTNTPDGTSSLLRYDLSDDEVQDAIRDAKLLAKMLNDTKKDINALWDEYSATEDEDARREIRIEIMRVCVDANAEISDYRAAYCYGNSAEQAVMNTLDLLTHSKAKTEE